MLKSQHLYNFAQLQSLELACVVGLKANLLSLPCYRRYRPQSYLDQPLIIEREYLLDWF